ncbi:hypothetical protein Cch01nite_24240 [Cellulomonas chitinilytica]|uniref:Carrier domain-containing protein n=1 Tax=Cellulomonas chitinilytica TaxID=398759 RepID=A0A919P2W0_9CELL|nr:acyl carrier protein [Cellulomonas chitinilytica]GIG21700.1 hypothetical protein Cch01nite_24240 [Cellulomonas chitinilytica]
MLNDAHITDIVTSAIIDLLGDLHDEHDDIPLDATFAEVGLNSLMLARLVIALETEVGVDPFTGDRSIVDVHTVRELVAVYAEVAGDEQSAALAR